MSGKFNYSVSMFDRKNKKWKVAMKFTSLRMIQRFYGDDFELTMKDIAKIYKEGGNNYFRINKLS